MATKPEFLHVNKLYFFLSLGLIALGMILMYVDSEPYGFGTVGLTVGAIVAMIGFLLPIRAVFTTQPAQAGNANEAQKK